MIKTIELTYFRKHEDLKVSFTNGLNVLRGPNEVGKTTLLEGVCFALFGAKSLRDTLAETVTWGQKESAMKVKAVITVANHDYVFTRSKGGAECNYDGGKVTGQNEVTAFASNLLSVDPKMANALIMASQSDLRGALDAGPAAVSSLMAKLADFDLIDRLVARAKKTLSLGSETPVRDRLGAARVELEAAEANPPSDASLTFLESMATSSQAQADQIRAELASTLHPALQQAQAALQQAQADEAKYNQVVDAINALTDKIRNTQGRIAVVQAASEDVADPAALAAVRQQIQDAKLVVTRTAQYSMVRNLPKYPDASWDKPEDDFLRELQEQRAEEAKLIASMAAANTAAATLRKQKITNGKCPTCGHAARSDEHVAEHNRGIEAQAQEKDKEFNTLSAKKNEVSSYIGVLLVVQNSAKPFKAAAQSLASCPDVKVDLGVFPPIITWVGTIPTSVDVKTLEAAEQALVQKDRAAERCKGQLVELKAVLAADEAAMAEHQAWWGKNTKPNVREYQDRMNAAAEAYNTAAAALQQHTEEANSYKLQHAQAKAAYEAAVQRLEVLRQQVAQCEADLTKLIFNNNFMAKLEKLKPAITDSLWQTVLAAVSNFFSSLRGEKSVVTKDASGFKVNGRSVESLSGSTIDVLAIALRVALTKTFIPATSFITLDEPAHGCDAMRTGNVLGFLASAGFQQILLASHDELSESVADNVVALS